MKNHSLTLEKYVSRSMRTVEGYLSSLDAHVIAELVAYQNENHIGGHLCEIGVHHGQLFLMLALARRAGERALAIDLFEDDAINRNTRHEGRDRALFVNARRLSIELSDEEVFKTSSLDITDDDIRRRTTGPIRFFSVDGCHLDRYVQHDLGLAERTLTPEGIIAVDDFFNPDWADVSFATCDFLRRTDALAPFAITAKLYLATAAMAETYKSTLRKCSRLGKFYDVQILGRDVLALREGALKKGYELVRERMTRCVS